MPTRDSQEGALRASVIDRFRRVATKPERERKFPVGPASAKKLGYEPTEVDALPSAAIESFCGVGNPFLLGQPLPVRGWLTWDAGRALTPSWQHGELELQGTSSAWI